MLLNWWISLADVTAPNERQKAANMKLIDHLKSHNKNIQEVRLDCLKVLVLFMGPALALGCNLFRNDPIGCMVDLRDNYSNASMEPLQVGQAFVNSLSKKWTIMRPSRHCLRG